MEGTGDFLFAGPGGTTLLRFTTTSKPCGMMGRSSWTYSTASLGERGSIRVLNILNQCRWGRARCFTTVVVRVLSRVHGTSKPVARSCHYLRARSKFEDPFGLGKRVEIYRSTMINLLSEAQWVRVYIIILVEALSGERIIRSSHRPYFWIHFFRIPGFQALRERGAPLVYQTPEQGVTDRYIRTYGI